MQNNIYEPPKSDIHVVDERPGSILKAVGAGTLIEVVGSLLVGILIGVIYAVILSRQGVSPEAMQEMLMHMDPTSGIGLLGVALGCLVSVLAGYICASIANTASYRAALILAAISCAMAILSGYGVYAWPLLVFMGGLSVGCVLGGAWLRNSRLKPS